MPWPSATDIGLDSLPPSATLDLYPPDAYFFKTDRGAQVGDIHMSLIHTCELCDANPSDYLTALQQHATAVKAAPAAWLPWNYRDAIASLAASS